MPEEDHLSATQALARAEVLDGLVRRRARWYARYLLIMGAMAFVSTFAIGLFPGPAGAAVSAVLACAVAGCLVVYALRQPVNRRGLAVHHGVVHGLWVILYLIVLTLGLNRFGGSLAWWLLGAFVVALPHLIGGLLEARR
ncbi:hypothetical protein DQ384_33785 [Sphaerisporangium album]|uniref:Uncharacterized protein n=1 Tax=Sphaerisporangium album TaxID=509200 RepID=A0A367F0Y1_9ACTN|nr:hypothetical protein [Sphaerisporangium album]RCG24024.1 hypothetical protein DQ384_33785 [Sphaerisporangium album]